MRNLNISVITKLIKNIYYILLLTCYACYATNIITLHAFYRTVYCRKQTGLAPYKTDSYMSDRDLWSRSDLKRYIESAKLRTLHKELKQGNYQFSNIQQVHAVDKNNVLLIWLKIGYRVPRIFHKIKLSCSLFNLFLAKPFNFSLKRLKCSCRPVMLC